LTPALVALAALLALAACARPAPLDKPMAVSFLPAPGELLSDAGDRLPAEDFRKRAQNATYVLIGESHGQPCDHEAEARLLTLLAHADGGQGLAVGLEMVPVTYSPVLAEFTAGRITPEDLPQRLDWTRTWGHPFKGYLPVLLTLRDWELPAAGLNVPPEVIRRLSAAAMNATAPDTAGLSASPDAFAAFAAAAVAALSPEDRALLPERIIPPAPEQLAFLRGVMAGHPKAGGPGRNPGDSRQLARFQLIQSVWDSAMAEQAVRLRKATGRQVAVLAGTAHVEGGLGIARRLRVLDPGAEILLVSPWRGDDFDPEDAQVRVFCPLSFESRMGMTLEERPDGADFAVVVTRVLRGSRADAAGLRPGDVLERAGGLRMRALSTLHVAGSDAYREKKSLVFVVRRGAARYSVDLGPLGQQKGQQKGQQMDQPGTTTAPAAAAASAVPASSPAPATPAGQGGKPDPASNSSQEAR
jgi:uncharacterized iron-regulated protein